MPPRGAAPSQSVAAAKFTATVGDLTKRILTAAVFNMAFYTFNFLTQPIVYAACRMLKPLFNVPLRRHVFITFQFFKTLNFSFILLFYLFFFYTILFKLVNYLLLLVCHCFPQQNALSRFLIGTGVSQARRAFHSIPFCRMTLGSRVSMTVAGTTTTLFTL